MINHYIRYDFSMRNIHPILPRSIQFELSIKCCNETYKYITFHTRMPTNGSALELITNIRLIPKFWRLYI